MGMDQIQIINLVTFSFSFTHPCLLKCQGACVGVDRIGMLLFDLTCRGQVMIYSSLSLISIIPPQRPPRLIFYYRIRNGDMPTSRRNGQYSMVPPPTTASSSPSSSSSSSSSSINSPPPIHHSPHHTQYHHIPNHQPLSHVNNIILNLISSQKQH